VGDEHLYEEPNIGVLASTCIRHINNKIAMWSHEVFPNHIPMTISRSSRPNTADLQPQVPPLSGPRFKHELFKHLQEIEIEIVYKIPKLTGCFLWALIDVPIIGLIWHMLNREPLIPTSPLAVAIPSKIYT
jgi:hypothetical protein